MEYIELDVLRKFIFNIVASLLYSTSDKHLEWFNFYYCDLFSSCQSKNILINKL